MVTGISTEWEDIQVKMGNWLPREKQPTTEEIFQENQERAENYDPLAKKKAGTMEQMIDDDPDLEDDDEFMKIYQEKRLQEMKKFAGQ